MRFVELLRATVLASAATATLLGALTVIGAAEEFDPVLVYVSASWWAVAAAWGVHLGRRNEASPAVARILATARTTSILPEQRPGRTLLNRLWPLAAFALVAGVAGFLAPPVAAIATGFAIIWPLSLRRQEQAVAAIEERYGVRFYLDRTSPVAPIALIRTPGFGGDFLSTPRSGAPAEPSSG